MTDDAKDALAEAYAAALNDPAVRSMYDAAEVILHALTAAGFAIVRAEACPFCGARNAVSCRQPPCRWTN